MDVVEDDLPQNLLGDGEGVEGGGLGAGKSKNSTSSTKKREKEKEKRRMNTKLTTPGHTNRRFEFLQSLAAAILCAVV